VANRQAENLATEATATKRNSRRVGVIAGLAAVCVVLVAVVALSASNKDAKPTARARAGAVTQITRAYACFAPNGQIDIGLAKRQIIRAYATRCPRGDQLVSWAVRGETQPAPPTAPTTVKPTSPTTAPGTTTATLPPVTGAEIRLPGTYITAYDYADNNPPNSTQISNPVIHTGAGGHGTAADPITVAVDHFSNGTLQFPKGTRFYIPNLRAYFIVEDTTGETVPSRTHLDVWAGGQTSTVASAFDCMSHVTGNYLVIRNPANNYAVVSGALSENNGCRNNYGDSIVVAAGTPTTIPNVPTTVPVIPGGSTACPTGKPASTYQGPTLTVNQTLKYAYDAGFRSVNQLQLIVGIGKAESSLVTQTRNWHPEYGCRPASNVIGTQGPASAWNGSHTQQINSDRGVWQISSHFWPQYTDAQTDDPAQAARAMFTISKSGSDFGPWDTFVSGSAQSNLPSVATVQAFLATQ
jgi:hypothetical protein